MREQPLPAPSGCFSTRTRPDLASVSAQSSTVSCLVYVQYELRSLTNPPELKAAGACPSGAVWDTDAAGKQVCKVCMDGRMWFVPRE